MLVYQRVSTAASVATQTTTQWPRPGLGRCTGTRPAKSGCLNLWPWMGWPWKLWSMLLPVTRDEICLPGWLGGPGTCNLWALKCQWVNAFMFFQACSNPKEHIHMHILSYYICIYYTFIYIYYYVFAKLLAHIISIYLSASTARILGLPSAQILLLIHGLVLRKHGFEHGFTLW